MGEYEPDDSRDVTQTDKRAPGEPPRTGPREDEARRRAGVNANAEEGAEAQGLKQAKGPATQAQKQQGQ